jgi:hypothetical protein
MRYRKLAAHTTKDSAELPTSGAQRSAAANGKNEARLQYAQDTVAASNPAPESTPSRGSVYQVVLTRR